MDEILVHRVAETVHHDHGDQQRHEEEVEILIQQGRVPGRHCDPSIGPDLILICRAIVREVWGAMVLHAKP